MTRPRFAALHVHVCTPQEGSPRHDDHPARDFTANRAWGALPVAEMNGITTGCTGPIQWHVNDGQEVFVVLEGGVAMRHRHDGAEIVTIMEVGDIFVASVGIEHTASPLSEAHVPL